MVANEEDRGHGNNEQGEGRIARYDEYFDVRSFAWTLRKTKVTPKKKGIQRALLIVRRIIDRKGQLDEVRVDIRSDLLAAVFREIFQGHEGLDINRTSPDAETALFFHALKPLTERLEREKAKPEPNAELIEHLGVALQFIQTDHKENIDNFERLTNLNEITYDCLWALFPPGCLAYASHKSAQYQLLRVRKVDYGTRWDKKKGNIKCFLLWCQVVTNDGTAFGLASNDSFLIDKYRGTCKIRALAIFPLKYHPDAEKLRNSGIERGRKFIRMANTNGNYYSVSGLALEDVQINTSSSESESEDNFRQMFFRVSGRCMIDPATFRRFAPNSTFNYPVVSNLSPEELTEENLAICVPLALGYSFSWKKWAGFSIEDLTDIIWNDNVFDTLVLNANQKRMMHALVRQHATKSKQFDDIISGKGKGLIGLLVGNPGCGKTLTAEAISEVTRKPLLSISAGDLGTEVKSIEDSLKSMLELGKTWEAVLLIDEAEVFLQRRSATEIKRNALVSVFLRHLEYYEGILILTTNLFENCDPAFESRIHFSLWYPDLDFTARKTLWEMFINNASKTTFGAQEFSESDIEFLAKMELNGRQIKNTVSNAQSLMLDSQTPLNMSHLRTVLDVHNTWLKAKESTRK